MVVVVTVADTRAVDARQDLEVGGVARGGMAQVDLAGAVDTESIYFSQDVLSLSRSLTHKFSSYSPLERNFIGRDCNSIITAS